MSLERLVERLAMLEWEDDRWWRHQKDTGCYAAPRCLECPLDKCVLDDQASFLRYKNSTRNAAIVEGAAAGEIPAILAVRYGVSTRTINRIIAAAKR